MSSETPELPPHLRPFVLPHEPVEPTRSGELELYLPASTPAPAVLMVHGGPVPRDREVRPPQWPAYRGYGALLAQAGLVGGMFEHGFVDEETLCERLKRSSDWGRFAFLQLLPTGTGTRIGSSECHLTAVIGGAVVELLRSRIAGHCTGVMLFAGGAVPSVGVLGLIPRHHHAHPS